MAVHEQALLPHLCAALRAMRKTRQQSVAEAAGVTTKTLGEFLAGVRWAQRTDEIVQAIGDLDGIDPLDIWKDALRRLEEGEQQQVATETPADAGQRERTKPPAEEPIPSAQQPTHSKSEPASQARPAARSQRAGQRRKPA